MSFYTDCQFCGAEYEAERSSSKFCSNSCKTKANTQRRENEFSQFRNEQRQAGIVMEAELQKKWDEQLAAENAEKNLQNAEQRKQQLEQRRSKAKEKLKKVSEKRNQKSEFKSKLKAVGIMAVLGIGYQLFKTVTKSDELSKPDHITKHQPDVVTTPRPEVVATASNNKTSNLNGKAILPLDENPNRHNLQENSEK